MPTPPPLSIDATGHWLSLRNDGRDNSTLLAASTTSRIVSGHDPRHGYRVARVEDSLLRPRDGLCRANGGLLGVLAEAAHQEGRGLMVRIQGHCPALPLPTPADDPAVCDGRVARFVGEHLRGLIRIGNSVRPEDVIAPVVAAYPTARIVILGAHQPQLTRIRQQLRLRLAGRRILHYIPPEHEEEESHAWVATSNFCDAGGGAFEKSHIVILVDATHATFLRAEAALATTDARFRLIGVLCEGRPLSPCQRDVLVATFGASVLDVPFVGCELAQVRVAHIDVNAPLVGAEVEGLRLRRRGYWHHHARNRRLARLARALRSCDESALAPFRDVALWLLTQPDRPLNVTIMVDEIEHALALAPLLPGWPIAADDDYRSLNLHGMAARDRRLLDARRSTFFTGEQRIVCQHVAPALDLSDVDVVVWAGGGPHAPTIPRRWLVHPAGGNRRLLVVDVTDRHHRQLAAWSEMRHREYRERDWFDVGLDDETGRSRRFLAARGRHHGRPRPGRNRR